MRNGLTDQRAMPPKSMPGNYLNKRTVRLYGRGTNGVYWIGSNIDPLQAHVDEGQQTRGCGQTRFAVALPIVRQGQSIPSHGKRGI